MTLHISPAAAARFGMDEGRLPAPIRDPRSIEDVDLMAIDGAATIIYVDREVRRYLNMLGR